jgi:hypothetical protein
VLEAPPSRQVGSEDGQRSIPAASVLIADAVPVAAARRLAIRHLRFAAWDPSGVYGLDFEGLGDP